MIEIALTLVSAQDGSRTDAGRATISLVGTNDRGREGDYRMRILKAALYSRNAGDTWKLGDIDLAAAPESRFVFLAGWPRKSRRVGPWELLLVCLDGLLRNRRPPIDASIDEERDARMRSAIGDVLMAITPAPGPDSASVAAEGLRALIEAIAGKLGLGADELLGSIAGGMPGLYTITEPDLQRLTESSFDHPDGWDGPCWCMECKASQ